jgi:hypothetical protein
LSPASGGNVESVRSSSLALGALVLVLAFSPFAGTPSAAAATSCWRAVIADWSRNGSIVGSYPPACYRQAMESAPTDLEVYSTLEDDLQAALRQRTARRLAGAHVAASSLGTSGGSSALVLVALVAGLGVLAAAGSAAAVLVRRRRTGS